MDTDFANVSGVFKANTDIVNKAISEVSPEHWFLKPGGDSNHLMWVLGHLVWSRGNVLKTLNEHWNIPSPALFERGAELTTQDEYPTVAEIRQAWDEVSARLSGILADVSVEKLSRPAPKGPPSFDGKVGGIVAFLAFHETYHVGQISYLRKWLGYGQSVG